MAEQYYAFCYADGQIQIGSIVPKNALLLATGAEKSLRDEVGVVARHGYTRGVLLVPGIPEADDLQEVINSVLAWVDWIRKGANRKCIWRTGDDLREDILKLASGAE